MRNMIIPILMLVLIVEFTFATALSTANPKPTIYGNPGADGTTIRMNTYNFITLNLANPNVWQGDQTGTITANIITSNTVDGTTLTVSGGKASLNINHANSWTAQQTGDITADCLTTGTVDGTTLTLSGCAAGINLANANVWTGAAEFDGSAYGIYVPAAFVAYTSGLVETGHNVLDNGAGSETIVGTMTSYDGDTTAGVGLGSIVGSVSSPGHSASITKTTILTTPAGCPCTYQINMYEVPTASTGSGSVTVTAFWTDVSGVAQSVQGIITNPNTPKGSYATYTQMIETTASSAIQYSTTYTSTGTYAVYLTVIRMS
jgi:hypothetical protein